MAVATKTASAEATNNKEFYHKKIQTKKLNSSLENITSKLAWQASIGIAVALALTSIDLAALGDGQLKLNNVLLAIAGVYALCFVVSFIVCKMIQRDTLSEKGMITKGTRAMGFILLPFIAVGNIFMCIAGFMIIKDRKGIEYQLSVYSVLSLLLTMIVSCLNLLKPTVASTFYLGLGVLGGGIVFNLLLMFTSNIWVNSKQVDKKMFPLAALSILQIGYGNVFGFLFGLIIVNKLVHKDEEISIEWIDVVRRLFKNYMAVIGMFVIVFLISISIFSYLTFDYDIAVTNDYANLLASPSPAYPFGTDNYGRCVFTRIIFGARISLIVGMVATATPILIGGMLGAIAGYYGGTTENIIMRILDVLYAVPGILLAIAIIAAFGASTTNLILALSVGGIPSYARTVRATVMTLSGQEFVEAARACGAKDGLIIFKHIIPNSLAPVIVRATLGIGGAVLSTSSLSYLGLGVEPHIPEWGNILKVGSAYLETNPYIAIFPGLAIILVVLSFNYFGDGLRDALDPKLK